ncbi:MAG: choloylglycine hydrolase family protein [Methanobrevibacter sp.]|jgi:choloylglycine hydrolase|nr:choloylglycine hydrolase family protein [Candidatus Methanovirga australis]
MCTSIFTETEDGKHFLARTMDFSFPLDGNPIFLPKGYSWNLSNGENAVNKFAILGTGRKIGENYLFTDGLNEKGVGIAELYLPGDAVYDKEEVEGKNNLAPWEFINWALGNFGSIDELEDVLRDIRFIEKPISLLGKSPPLHFIVGDTTGRVVVIEPTGGELVFKENPVGVMTNTPNLEWHIQNLRNYVGVHPKQFSPKRYGEFIAEPFSQGTGTSELPGGYTPSHRFVRAAFFKEYIDKAKNEEEGVTNIWQILSTVRVPKGIVVINSNGEDYTQYISAMCLESKSFYFTPYENNQINKVEINDKLLSNGKVVVFNVVREQMYQVSEGEVQ